VRDPLNLIRLIPAKGTSSSEVVPEKGQLAVMAIAGKFSGIEAAAKHASFNAYCYPTLLTSIFP